MDKTYFPIWFDNAINSDGGNLRPAAKEFYKKILGLMPHLRTCYLEIPPQTEIGVLKSYQPDVVESYYENKESVIEFIIFNIFEQFHFNSRYQIRELLLSLFSAIENGNFYTAAIINRAALEVICVNYFTFRRVENNFDKSLNRIEQAQKTSLETVRDKLITEYFQATYDIFSLLFDSNNATSINWQEYYKKLGIDTGASAQSKKIHVNSVIEDVAKASKLPLVATYEIFSEFVHPNVGSKMLIVVTKSQHDKMMDKLTIGNNKNNSEAVLFYAEHFAEGMYYTLTLALSLVERSQRVLDMMEKLVPVSADKPDLASH